MRTSRVAGLLFLATATLAQQQSVEITSEPSHHLVFQNEYVRVFDVTVAPRATTLIHRHHSDYLFVTLGDSDVVSTRVGEKPVALHLKDGEVRYTPGNFAHAAGNESDRPFHNITIELLKPSTNVKTCTEACLENIQCGNSNGGLCPATEKRISSDQWTISLVTLPPSSSAENLLHSDPQMVVAVSDIDLKVQARSSSDNLKRATGGLAWIPDGTSHAVVNKAKEPARFITLEFKADKS